MDKSSPKNGRNRSKIWTGYLIDRKKIDKRENTERKGIRLSRLSKTARETFSYRRASTRCETICIFIQLVQVYTPPPLNRLIFSLCFLKAVGEKSREKNG